MRNPFGLSRLFWRVWQRNLTVYRESWQVNFVPPLLEPLLYLLAFGVGLGGLVGPLQLKRHPTEPRNRSAIQQQMARLNRLFIHFIPVIVVAVIMLVTWVPMSAFTFTWVRARRFCCRRYRQTLTWSTLGTFWATRVLLPRRFMRGQMTRMKRLALEQAYSPSVEDLPAWQDDMNLLNWLQRLCQ